MFKVAWKEVATNGRVVRKQRRFWTPWALEAFVDTLVEAPNFCEITSYRNPA